ncbi:MAG: PQQ-dependent dehydrogenase, methanol/ethanol family [Bryobacteraceae bacterium]
MKPLFLFCAAFALQAQVTPPGANWPTYHGSEFSQHYSTLTQLTPANVSKLNLAWTHQAQSLEKFETTPLVIDGVMYLTEAPNTIVALDPVSGRPYWVYEHKLPEITYPCCGKVTRGVAYANGLIYFATHDAKVIALDARTGRLRWENTLIDHRQGYSFTHAPLIVKDKVIVGSGGGELGIRGFLAALDAKTGKEIWRFQIIPEPGQPGSETWSGDAWKHGGGSIWLTGSYDPELNLTYWGTGNPGPDWNPAVRPGDNLYSDSVLALDADTGKLKWHFQFTPHDEWDWDAVQTPVLVDREWNGRQRKLMFWASRNGFFYVFDRTNGQFLMGKEFVKQTWAKGLDERGRPMRIPGMGPSKQGTKTYPGVQGGTNWYAPAYSPRTGLFYLTAWDDYHGTYFAWDQQYEQGKWYAGGGVKAPVPPTRRERIVTRDTSDGYAAVRALDPLTGKLAWDYKMQDMSESGLLATATDLLFSGNRDGHFFALDARSGKLLWRRYLGGQVIASPITFEAEGKQYVSIAAGHTLYTFALPSE